MTVGLDIWDCEQLVFFGLRSLARAKITIMQIRCFKKRGEIGEGGKRPSSCPRFSRLRRSIVASRPRTGLIGKERNCSQSETFIDFYDFISPFFDWEDISKPRDRVWSHFQTPRISLKILRCASYFQLSSRCLKMWSNPISRVWYITWRIKRIKHGKV